MDLAKYFQFKEHNTSMRKEVLAGVTTFMTMAYILAVNPEILSAAGMDKGAVFTATAVASALATIIMALYAKLPFALAPGMGLNAFFAFGVCIGMGHSWQFALTAIFIEGILFILMTLFNIRELIVDAIPYNLKLAIGAGVGLFIAFIGMQSAGIIVDHPSTLVALGDFTDTANYGPALAFAGLILTSALLIKKVRGALMLGIFITTFIGIPLGVTQLPTGFDLTPPSLSPIFMQFEWDSVFTIDMAVIVITFLFMDIFNTLGTLIGVAAKADMLDENGNIPNVKKALYADAVGTTAGAMLGTSTVTVFVESAAGVADGGRTGMTALSTAVLFLLSLFVAPLFLMVPSAATAPILVIVGAMMLGPIKNIDLEDYSSAIPAFVTIVMMPLSYSIADGIIFGMLTHVGIKLLTGKAKELSPMMYILSVLFIGWFFI